MLAQEGICDFNQQCESLLLYMVEYNCLLMKSVISLAILRIPQKLKDKFYRTAIRPAMLYGAECWPTKKRYVQQISVAEMRMLRWICGHTRRDRVRNDDIRDRLGVAPIKEKLVQHRLRWFGHVQRRPLEAPVRSGILSQDSNVKRGRGRPKLTWVEAIK